eukprot:3341119-Heterocapsa_arctica.AAC.1
MEAWDKSAAGGQEATWHNKGTTQGKEDPTWQQPRRGGAMPPDERTVSLQMVKPGQFDDDIPPEERDAQG